MPVCASCHPKKRRACWPAGSPSLKPIVMTALYTGFRTSELLSLTWADVDFRRRAITVRARYAKKGESKVPMNNSLHMTLKMARISTTGDGPVFCTPQGTPCRNFRTAFERAVRKAGIADFTFHDCAIYLCEPPGDGGCGPANGTSITGT